jgi:Uma2 family endonuclease
MGTKTAISPEAYLAKRFEWEPEYVHGELKERSMPDFVHGRISSRFAILLALLERQQGLFVGTEVRCKVTSDIYRLPDVILAKEFERVPSTPPIMVAEILSRDDAYVDVVEKAEEYATWGVPHIWLIDPWSRRLQVWTGNAFKTVDQLELPQFGWSCTIDDLIEGIPAEALKR